MVQVTNTREPTNTGDQIYENFAFIITPKTAIAPAGGCKHRNNCPKAIVLATATPHDMALFPKQIKDKTAETDPNKFPNKRFLGWAKGLSEIPKRITVDAPKGAINNDCPSYMQIIDKK